MIPNSEDESAPLVKSLSNFKVLKKLSHGRFSKVVLAETAQDQKTYAIKIIKQHDKPTINYQSYNSLSKIQNEIKIMKFLGHYDHPHILKLFNVITNNKEIDNNYNQNRIYLILEYCSQGELSYKKLTDINHTLRVFRSIISAVEFLHLNDIVHRDIKPSNILMDSNGDIKLSDFGISYKMTGDESVDQFEMGSTFGTPLFMPPELCSFKDTTTTSKWKCKLDYKMDIWSLGITFYWLIFQNFPYFSDNEFKLFHKIVEDPISFKTMNNCPIFNSYTNEYDYGHGEKIIIFTNLCDLIEKMLNKNPSKRYTIEQLKKSEAVTYAMNDKDRKNYLKFNNFFIQPKKDLSQSSLSSIESAFNKLMKKKTKHRPSPIQILDNIKSDQRVLPDIPDYKPQAGDDVVSDLETSSSSLPSSEDSEFINSTSTHQLFVPVPGNAEILNNSCFSLPLFDNRRSDNTMISTNSSDTKNIIPQPQFLSGTRSGGNNSAPITPLSPTYTSQISSKNVPSDTGKKTDNSGKFPRSKGAFNLSKITASKGINDLHSIIADSK